MNFLDLVRSRCSVRNYDASKPVEKEKLDYIMECARMAPSAVNFQPWKFYVLKDSDLKNSIIACYNREWIKSAPVIIVACANHKESWKRKSDNKDHADIDVAISVEHICLAAREQGLGSCWVCNFDVALCREILNFPSYEEPVVLIPIGYESGHESKEKSRKDTNEIVSLL